MSLHLEWVFECERCRVRHRQVADPQDMICDSDPVPVGQPKTDWETDGLGGWLCPTCYPIWDKENKR